MPFGRGARVGPYEILSAIAAGGMGQVYRATDTNLGRQVAIKVLPDTFLQDPERRTYDVSHDGARFFRIKVNEESAISGAAQGLVVVQHWTEELKRLVPTKSR